MTTPDLRARLHALIADHIDTARIPRAVADKLLAEAIAANAVVGSRAITAALLRRMADELDGQHAG
jgi:hypothetical protein